MKASYWLKERKISKKGTILFSKKRKNEKILTTNFDIAKAFAEGFDRGQISLNNRKLRKNAFSSHCCSSKVNDIMRGEMYSVCFKLKSMVYNL